MIFRKFILLLNIRIINFVTGIQNGLGGVIVNLRGYCGINCEKCDVYRATLEDDEELRIKTAEKWSRETGLIINPEDINCKGCFSEYNDLCSFAKKCKIRMCAVKRVSESCGKCEEYPCKMLRKFLKPIPEAKKYLDEVNRG